jgi:hypothetical protein
MRGVDWELARRVAVVGALLCGACGGDSGTGPGGGGGGVGGEYDLVGINNTGVPAVVQIENCRIVRFVDGSLRMGNGTWQLDVDLEFEYGADGLADHGAFEQDGSALEFESAEYGDRFEGAIEDGLVVLYYDWCSDGNHDVDLVFER